MDWVILVAFSNLNNFMLSKELKVYGIKNLKLSCMCLHNQLALISFEVSYQTGVNSLQEILYWGTQHDLHQDLHMW